MRSRGAESTVTVRPTKDTVGERTYTCECGETWTEVIPVAVLKTTADDSNLYKVGHTLSLQSSIAIGFRLRSAFVDDAVDCYAVFNLEKYDKSGNVTGYSPTYVYAEDFISASNGTRYDVTYSGATSAEMSSLVYADIYRELSDGTFEYVTDTFSIVEYANSQFGTKTDELNTLLMDMLNYGTAAQIHFNYNISNPANKAYDKFDDYADCASETAKSYTNYSGKVNNAGDDYAINLSRQLSLGSSITILSLVRNTDKSVYTGDISNLRAKCEYKAFDGADTVTWIDSEDFEIDASTGHYSVAFDKLTTVEIDTKVEISIYDGEKLISDTVSYSIGSYLEILKKSSSTDTTSSIYVLVENMNKYCTAAINYFYPAK